MLPPFVIQLRRGSSVNCSAVNAGDGRILERRSWDCATAVAAAKLKPAEQRTMRNARMQRTPFRFAAHPSRRPLERQRRTAARRTAPRTALAACVALAASGCNGPSDTELVELDAVELRDRIAAGELSAERVTAAFLERIAALDAAGPELRAVLEVNPDALAIARELDRSFDARGPVGPLHGVPVLLKANIDTADR